MTECELLLAVRDGSESAYESLLGLYEPLLISLVSRFDTEALVRDELMQEARYALYRASCAYDTAQSAVTFGLYAKICIRRALFSFVRRAMHRDMHQVPLSPIGENDEEESLSDPLLNCLFAEEQKKVDDVLASQLSAFERQVFVRYLGGDASSHIAEDLGIGRKTVQNAIYRSQKKLRKYYHVYMPQ